jgi:hypothetical protein
MEISSSLNLPLVRRLCVLSAAFFLPLCFSIRLEDGFELTQAFCAICLIAFLYLTSWKENWFFNLWRHAPVYWLFLFFFLLGFISFLKLRGETTFYFPTQNYLWVLTALLFLTPLGVGLDKRRFYAFLVFSGIVGSFYSFGQVLGQDLSGWSTNFGGRSFSTLGNPVFWAGHLLVLLPLALYLAVSADGKTEKRLWLGALAVLMLSLLITQTRGAWLGVLGEAAVLVFLLGKRNRTSKLILMGVIVFLLAIFLVPSLKGRAISIFQYKNQDAKGRYFLWQAAFEQWKQKKWLGQGPGGYANRFQQTQMELSQRLPYRPYLTAFHAHNEYLEFLAERGLLGCLAGFYLLRALIFRRVKKKKPEPFGSAEAELAVMTGIGIQSLFNFPLSIVPTACVLALLFNPHWDDIEYEADPEIDDFLSKKKWRFAAPAIGAGLLIVCGLAVEVLAQNARLHQAVDLIGERRHGEAADLLNSNASMGFFHYLDPRILKQKATAMGGFWKEPEAVPVMQRLAEAYPYDADAYVTLCMLYGKQKKWEKAEAMGRKALAIAPYHELGLNNMAVAAYLQGRKKDARQYLSKLQEAYAAWGMDEKVSEISAKMSSIR